MIVASSVATFGRCGAAEGATRRESCAL